MFVTAFICLFVIVRLINRQAANAAASWCCACRVVRIVEIHCVGNILVYVRNIFFKARADTQRKVFADLIRHEFRRAVYAKEILNAVDNRIAEFFYFLCDCFEIKQAAETLLEELEDYAHLLKDNAKKLYENLIKEGE